MGSRDVEALCVALQHLHLGGLQRLATNEVAQRCAGAAGGGLEQRALLR
jgi:hypothetical protein